MKKLFALSNDNAQTKIYLCLKILASFAALVIALFECFSMTISQLAILATAMVVAVLVGWQTFDIKGTRAKFPAGEIVAFWGTIWLGTAGAVLLAASFASADYSGFPKDKNRWLARFTTKIISVAAASLFFYAFLSYVAGFAESPLAGKQIGIHWLVAAVLIMALTYYAVLSALKLAFKSVRGGLVLNPREYFTAAGTKYLLVAGGLLLIHFLFLKFGLWFGLVILPIVAMAHLAYRMHVKSLAHKTKQTTEANRIHVATVEALATAIDARDQVGIGHVRRTQILAVGIGEVLGLPNDEIEALRTGALLHDIGKLAVPDHILNKPGRLTPAEMEKMKIHASVGAAILEKINFPHPVVPTVQYHHEMWDGKGYPKGLKKEEIPLTARILAIADAYDSLRGARPYRAAVTREEARHCLLNGAGTQFDPKLIDIFLRNLRRFELEIEAQGLSYNSDGEAEDDLFSSIEPNAADTSQGYIAQIKRANREVYALYELARVFSSARNLEDTLSLFVKKIGELVPFDTCVVYLLDKTQEIAVAAHSVGKYGTQLRNKKIKPGDGATGSVLQKRQAVYNIDPALDFPLPRLDFIREYRAMASLPLITEEKMVGAVSLYSCGMKNYEDEHMRLLETVSRIAADAIFKSIQHADAESRALTDPMTGLPNARSLQLQFENEVARARRNDHEFQVLMLDLDGFKAVNDTFGHKVGDTLLKELSKVMREQLRDYDFLARYAGDEFVVIVPETNKKDVRELCERMEAAVLAFALPVEGDKLAKVGVSLGAAGYPQHGETLDQVIVAADKAMYAVKARHRQQKNSPTAEKAPETEEEVLLVELDESHIISTAIN